MTTDMRVLRLCALLTASAIGWITAGTAIAAPFDDGVAAYQRGDYHARAWKPEVTSAP